MEDLSRGIEEGVTKNGLRGERVVAKKRRNALNLQGRPGGKPEESV